MSGLSPLGLMVRRHDPDRFLTALFAAPDRRETLFALYAFNHELARAWEVASHPTLALIRLQWWREILEGATRRHEVATPLMAEVAAGRLHVEDLAAMIEGRERLEVGLPTLPDWQAYLAATAGRLALTAGRALGGDGDVLWRLLALGGAYGVAGHLRSSGIWGGHMPARPPADLRGALRDWAREQLGQPGPINRSLVSAGLVGVLARRDLRSPDVKPVRGLGDRGAVLLAACRARV